MVVPSFRHVLYLSAILLFTAGCGTEKAEEPSSTESGSVTPAAASPEETAAKGTTPVETEADTETEVEPAKSDEPIEPEIAKEEPAEETEKEPANSTETVETTEEDNDAEKDEPAEEVDPALARLGVDELTSGIPGEGALTMDQINAWLEDEKNHLELMVELPLGLSSGKGAISIPDDNPMTRAKIELGRQLYFDRKLSADNSVSCADCHHPEEGYGRQTQFGVGIDGQEGNRNSPVSYNRILSDAQFWDGRAGSLEEQAVGPIANPIEMGNTHEKAVETVKGIEGYTVQFAKIFPEDGVTIDNIGKALATFERAIVSGPSPYDYYESLQKFTKMDPEDLQEILEDDEEFKAEYDSLLASSETYPMSESAVRGRDLFFSKEVNCSACHVGANLTDEKYHNLGVGMDVEEPDLGRFAVTNEEVDKGAFKTPTIRNVEFSAPYMHDGSLATLEEVVQHYNNGGVPNPQLSDKVEKLNLNEEQVADLVAFMKACSGEFPKVEQGRLPE